MTIGTVLSLMYGSKSHHSSVHFSTYFQSLLQDMEEMEKGTLESLALIGAPDEPPEIARSRDQLKNLNVQRQRLETDKEALQTDLQQCRDKAGMW